MDAAQALGYLDSLILHGVKVGLEHTRRLAERLGSPQKDFPCVLVAGTNGKGSTASFLESILRASGMRVGLFTSPHLVDVRERVRVRGRLIGEKDFAAGLARVKAAADGAARDGLVEGPPTYFEALTLLALDHFAREGVDAAVLEVGLGGRLDCTNIVEPEVAIVTTIGLDHQEYLGHDLASIAREKAGIFRAGVPAFTAAVRPEAISTLAEEAWRAGADLKPLSAGRIVRKDKAWRLEAPGVGLDLPYPALAGAHQLNNAALAVLGAWHLRGRGWPVTPDTVREGLSAARWPGRLETVAERPLVILDGAHNPDGCAALAAHVRTLAPSPKALVLATMRDKPVELMGSAILPEFQAVWATAVPMARACPAVEVARRLGGAAAVVEDPREALEAARRWAGPGGLVVAAGSLYLVGHLMAGLAGHRPTSWGSGL